MRPSLVLCLALSVVAVTACRNKKDDPDPLPNGGDDESGLAEDGTDANSAENDSEALTSTLVGGGSGGTIGLASAGDLAGGLSARTIGDGVKAIYMPRGCVTVTSTETAPGEGTAKYTFDGCSGPAGLFNVKGVVDVTFKASANHLVLDLVGNDLQVNRATIDWTAHAEIDASGADRTMTWHATIAGTTARGREIARTNDKTIAWTVGEPCIALDGVSQGNVSGRELKTEVTSFRRCRGSCPEAGGKIVVTNLDKNRSIEIRYDGTSQATFVGANGKETKFSLLCR